MSALETALRISLERIAPAPTFEESLHKLLLDQARRNLVRFRALDNQFRRKYKMSFERFRAEQLSTQMSFETEQDYFDWEMAVTGIEEMETEIRRLEALVP